jgi:hypothetical protein
MPNVLTRAAAGARRAADAPASLVAETILCAPRAHSGAPRPTRPAAVVGVGMADTMQLGHPQLEPSTSSLRIARQTAAAEAGIHGW